MTLARRSAALGFDSFSHTTVHRWLQTSSTTLVPLLCVVCVCVWLQFLQQQGDWTDSPHTLRVGLPGSALAAQGPPPKHKF